MDSISFVVPCPVLVHQPLVLLLAPNLASFAPTPRGLSPRAVTRPPSLDFVREAEIQHGRVAVVAGGVLAALAARGVAHPATLLSECDEATQLVDTSASASPRRRRTSAPRRSISLRDGVVPGVSVTRRHPRRRWPGDAAGRVAMLVVAAFVALGAAAATVTAPSRRRPGPNGWKKWRTPSIRRRASAWCASRRGRTQLSSRGQRRLPRGAMHGRDRAPRARERRPSARGRAVAGAACWHCCEPIGTTRRRSPTARLRSQRADHPSTGTRALRGGRGVRDRAHDIDRGQHLNACCACSARFTGWSRRSSRRRRARRCGAGGSFDARRARVVPRLYPPFVSYCMIVEEHGTPATSTLSTEAMDSRTRRTRRPPPQKAAPTSFSSDAVRTRRAARLRRVPPPPPGPIRTSARTSPISFCK